MEVDKDKFDALLQKLINKTQFPAKQIKTKRTKAVIDRKAEAANDK